MGKRSWVDFCSSNLIRTFCSSYFNLIGTNVPTRAIHSVETAQRYLDLARECMEHVQRISTSLQFNHGQCEYLIDKLTVAVQSAEVWAQKDSSGFKSKWVEIMKLLWRSAKEVESFTQGCCKDNWIQAAIIMANRSEFVSSWGFNLEFCTFLLLNVNTAATARDREHHLDALSVHESDVVKGRVSCDQRKLLTRLDTVILSGNSRDEDCQLARFLLGRLRQHLEGSVQLKVWSIDFSSLKQVQRLGSGSVGTVRKSMWLAGQIEVAEKVFFGPDHPDFKNEVEILAGLAHPNIVPFLGYATDGDECSVVMELMDEDLLFHMRAKLRENATRKFPFTNFEAVDMMLQTALGMLYLHDKRVVHRDLKSQNILVKRRKYLDGEYIHVKVADFGLAKTKEMSITHSNLTPNTGTTRWMAPELMTMGGDDSLQLALNYDRQLRYPFKVDIYSFGMVCYEILSGKVPFTTISSPTDVRKMVLNGDRPEIPDQCPETLKTLIQSCWESEPSQRPSFVEICRSLRSLRYSLLKGLEMGTARKKSSSISTERISGISLEYQEDGVEWRSARNHLHQLLPVSEYSNALETMSEHFYASETMSEEYFDASEDFERVTRDPQKGSLGSLSSHKRILRFKGVRQRKRILRFKGVRQRKGIRGYLVEIRPPKWKRTIWLGTYHTDREAAGAYDAGIFYTHKNTSMNFPHLEGTFPPLPPQLRFDNADDSEEIKMFTQREARLAAQKVRALWLAETTATSSVTTQNPEWTDTGSNLDAIDFIF